jgi:hypothetical protein
MMKAITSLPSTALVETCLPAESYFSKRPQLLTRV